VAGLIKIEKRMRRGQYKNATIRDKAWFAHPYLPNIRHVWSKW